jgi:hypothetical protein
MCFSFPRNPDDGSITKIEIQNQSILHLLITYLLELLQSELIPPFTSLYSDHLIDVRSSVLRNDSAHLQNAFNQMFAKVDLSHVRATRHEGADRRLSLEIEGLRGQSDGKALATRLSWLSIVDSIFAVTASDKPRSRT